MKLFLLLLFINLAWAQDPFEKGEEKVLYQVFSPTAFGIKSRTIDEKDAQSVIALMKSFLLSSPQAVVSRVDILTCTSDYELPQAIIAQRKANEHLELAKVRHSMVEKEFKKSFPYSVTGGYQICGPEFTREDLNDRFVTKESGELYQQKLNRLLEKPEYLKQLEEFALMTNPESISSIYPSIFLAKFRPFQGIRLKVWGYEKQSKKIEINPKQPSGKNQ